MKMTYVSPELDIVCFLPIQRLATDLLDLDKDLVNIGSTYSLTRATPGSETEEEEGDIPLPIG